MHWLGRLQEQAERGQFGRALPAAEQVFLILADSVVKQLDGLKDDPNLSRAIRRFLGKGLDAYGPAGGLAHTPHRSSPHHLPFLALLSLLLG